MKLPVHCEHCGKLIATYDTSKDTDASFLEAPCGEKVCEDCCDECDKNGVWGENTYHCSLREDSLAKR